MAERGDRVRQDGGDLRLRQRRALPSQHLEHAASFAELRHEPQPLLEDVRAYVAEHERRVAPAQRLHLVLHLRGQVLHLAILL